MRERLFLVRLFAWFSLRHLKHHRWRALAVVAGIALGAAVFTSVRIAVRASLHSFVQSMDAVTGTSDGVVVRPGGAVPETLVAPLVRLPEVETASPLITAYVEPEGRGDLPLLLIGIDPILDRPLRHWKASAARAEGKTAWLELMKNPEAILLAEAAARELAASPGETLTLSYGASRKRFRVIGVLESQGLALADGGLMGLVDIATAQEFLGRHGVVDRIDLRARPGRLQEMEAAVRGILPPGVALDPPGETKESGTAMIEAYEVNLSILSFVSLFVGMFLVYSLVALNATSRRRELAALRSIGASRSALFRLFILEGAFLGLLGWALGIPLGTLLVHQMVRGVSATVTLLFARVRPEGMAPGLWEIGLSFLVTLGVSLLAAYQPAHQAMTVRPREVLKPETGEGGDSRAAGRLFAAGTALIAIVWPLSNLPPVSGIPLAGYLAVFILFCGFAFLSPLFLRRTGAALAPPLRRIGGEPAFLASRYIRDSGVRVAVSVGALITAVALFTALVIMTHSFRNTVELWVRQTVAGDVFVRPRTAGANDYRDPLPQEAVAMLQAAQESWDVAPYRHFSLHYAGVPYQLEAVAFEDLLRHASFIFCRGDPTEALEQAASGRGVLVSEVFWNRTGLGPGDRFQAMVLGTLIDLPVCGVFRDYRTRGGMVYISLDHFRHWTGDTHWSGARLFLKDPSEHSRGRIEAFRRSMLLGQGARHGLEVILGTELRREILRIFDETFAITTVLLAMALLVAGLGIATTLTVLVLERSVQLNTLRAVGADASQIRSLIVWEAVFLVSAGVFLGLLCGGVLSVILIHVINRQSFGWTFLYSVDWPTLAASVPAIFLAAVAAVVPAYRRALRQSPASLLREQS